MTSLIASEADSRLAQALRALCTARGVGLTPADAATGPGTLVITDLLPALMSGATRARGLDEARHARIEALIAQAAGRIVLVSAPLTGTAEASPAGQDARRIEAVLAERAAGRSVILRVADVMDPTDPDLRAILRSLIDGGPALRWPGSDPVQVIALADLVAATFAATQARGIEGKWFDIVHPEAASREAVLAEARRIAALLVNADVTETQSRPAYPPVEPRRDGSAGAEALHVRPRLSVFVLLAQAIQGMIAESVQQGTIPPIHPPMPALHRALETGALPLAGMTAVVTGATGQIGGAAARMLVRLGADVIGVARRVEAGARMEARLAAEHDFVARQQRRLDAERCRRAGGAPVMGRPGRFRFMAADLSDATARTRLAARLTAEVPQIDILLHAAGEISRVRRETAQGVEGMLELHLLAPVALTRLLAGPLAQGRGAWIVNAVSADQTDHPFDLTDLQSRQSYLPAEVLARAHSGLVALTGALAAGMAGTRVRIAAVALPPVRSPFRDPLEDPVTGGATAQQVAQTRAEQRRRQMGTPGQAASQLIEVMLAQELAQAHGCLVQNGDIAAPIVGPGLDSGRLAALWSAAAQLSGLPE